MQIISLQDSDSLERIKKEGKAVKSELAEKTGKLQTEDLSAPVMNNTDAQLSSGRITLRIQRTIDGFNEVFSAMKKNLSQDSKQEALNKIISNTRFQNERVLKDFTPQLQDIIRDNDFNSLLALTEKKQIQLHQYATNEIISQNMAAVESKNPESLLQEVTAQLRRGKLPEFKIERSRILDLLS